MMKIVGIILLQNTTFMNYNHIDIIDEIIIGLYVFFKNLIFTLLF